MEYPVLDVTETLTLELICKHKQNLHSTSPCLYHPQQLPPSLSVSLSSLSLSLSYFLTLTSGPDMETVVSFCFFYFHTQKDIKDAETQLGVNTKSISSKHTRATICLPRHQDLFKVLKVLLQKHLNFGLQGLSSGFRYQVLSCHPSC